MRRSHIESLLSSTQSFFQKYLRQTRGASAHTVRAYRDALKLFFLFLADHERKPVAGLTLDDVRANTVLAFLEHISKPSGATPPLREIAVWRPCGALFSIFSGTM